MLKDRSLQVKMVKDGDPSPPVDIDHLANTVTKSVVTVIGFYVGCDIVRRAAIYILSAKI